jgi:hypothetical protein
MHAINSMRLPKDFFRSFNLGGLVLPPFPSPPRFAQGGLAAGNGQSLRPIVLNIVGKGSFNGMIDAPEHVVESLNREAVFEQLAAGGRSPNWRRS